MSIRTKTGKAILWTAAQGWGGQLISFFIYALLARFLTPVEFGLVAMAMVFVAFTQIFIDQGLSSALIQRKDISENYLSTAFWSNVVAGIFLTGFGFLASNLISSVYRQPELQPVLIALSLMLLLNSLCSVQTAIYKRQLEYKPLAIATFLDRVIGGVVGIYMAISGYGVWSLVGQQLSSRIVHLLCLWFQSNWRPTLYWSKSHFLDLYKYGINILGINITEYLNRYGDNFLIGFYLGPELLGYYALAYKFYRTLISLLSGLFSQVAFSAFSSIQSNTLKIRSAFYEMINIMGFIAFPLFAGAIALAEPMFGIMFGDAWDKSIIVFQLLMLVCFLESIFLFNGSVMLALNKPHWRFRLNIINSIANLIGFYFAVEYGIEYVAAAYVLRSYLLSPLSLKCVQNLIDIDFKVYFSKLLPHFTGMLIMFIGITYIQSTYLSSSSVPTIIFGVTLSGAAIYALLTLLVNRRMFFTLFNTVTRTFK